MKKKHRFFVTGIDTEVGKTVVSAVLVQLLQADYWKPIQAGDLDFGDTEKVQQWTDSPHSTFFPPQFALNTPASPHYAALLDNIDIKVKDFVLPETENNLIVEGAGGLMVPLNDNEMVLDLIKKLGLEVILVSKNYLGSINHTLLSIIALQNAQVPIKGIIFNQNNPNNQLIKGYEKNKNNQLNPPYRSSKIASTESVILKYTGINYLGHIPKMEEVDIDKIKDVGRVLDL